MAETKGMTHGEIMKIRHYDHQQKALAQIRDLRQQLNRDNSLDIGPKLDQIFADLDHKIAP